MRILHVDAAIRWGISIPTIRLVVLAIIALISSAALAQTGSRLTPVASSAEARAHGLVILVDSDDEKVMRHAIAYSMNIVRAYAATGETVKVEVVANGSGIKLLRADTSPLQEPLAMLQQAIPDIVLSMCDSSRRIAEQKEGRSIPLVPGARLVPFGIRRVTELQEAGWSFVHG